MLTGASCWPSSNCIPVQEIASLSTELTHNRSVLALDSDSVVCCHHSCSWSISGFSTLRPGGQIRPTKPFHPAAKHILPIMKKYYINEKLADKVECNTSLKITLSKMLAHELLCNSLCGPLPKTLKSPGLYELGRQSQTHRRGCHCWERQDEPGADPGGAIGAIASPKTYESNFTMILYNPENSIRDIRRFCDPLFCRSSVVKYTSSLLQ